MNLKDKLKKLAFGLMVIVFSCVPEEKQKSENFSWVSETETLSRVGDGVLSRPNSVIYNFAFTAKGDTIFYHTTDKGDGEAGVAMSVYNNNEWSEPKPAPFDTETFNEGHVSMNPNGNKLIFSSDRTENLQG